MLARMVNGRCFSSDKQNTQKKRGGGGLSKSETMVSSEALIYCFMELSSQREIMLELKKLAICKKRGSRELSTQFECTN